MCCILIRKLFCVDNSNVSKRIMHCRWDQHLISNNSSFISKCRSTRSAYLTKCYRVHGRLQISSLGWYYKKWRPWPAFSNVQRSRVGLLPVYFEYSCGRSGSQPSECWHSHHLRFRLEPSSGTPVMFTLLYILLVIHSGKDKRTEHFIQLLHVARMWCKRGIEICASVGLPFYARRPCLWRVLNFTEVMELVNSFIWVKFQLLNLAES